MEDVTSLKYLGATLCKDDTCSADVRIRIASAMARLNRIWRCNTINFASKFKLYKSLVTSLLFCGCETWTLLTDSEKLKKIHAFETKCKRKLLCIFYLQHKTRDWVQSTINFHVGPQAGICSRNCQETDTCMVQARHTPR